MSSVLRFPLSKYLDPTSCLENSTNRRIAFKSGKTILDNQFFLDVTHFVKYLYEQEDKRIGLYFTESYHFSVALFAVIASKNIPVLLPSVQPAYLKELKPGVDLLVSDIDSLPMSFPGERSCIKSFNDILEDADQKNSIGLSSKRVSIEGAFIELFTSGSSGKPTRIRKSFRQLEAEIEMLELVWGEQLSSSVVLATVSQQHIYGLLFRVLWPLCTGRSFLSELSSHPEEELQQIDEPVTLVSSPAYLNRIAKRSSLAPYAKNIEVIFSSGGPLASFAAVEFLSMLGKPIVEVFGSSETGGVAYRTQNGSSGSLLWKPFPTVQIDIEPDLNRLLVRSPHLGQDGWYMTADVGEIDSSGHFRFKGRSDRIVKVEEKRLSLDEVERKLLESPFVREGAAIVLAGHRSCIAVALVLTPAGEIFLEENGKWRTNQHFKEHLAMYFERVLLPRKWRYIASLPLNFQGKRTQEDMEALFETDSNEIENASTGAADGSQTLPVVTAVCHRQESVELSLIIPFNLRYFDGHFSGAPILPGVVQIDWAFHFASQYYSFIGRFLGLEAIKFHALIRPNDSIKLELYFIAEKNKLRFVYSSENGTCSSGRFVFG